MADPNDAQNASSNVDVTEVAVRAAFIDYLKGLTTRDTISTIAMVGMTALVSAGTMLVIFMLFDSVTSQ